MIALDERDAIAAERGGADRLEVVSAMESDGLTPSLDSVERILAATEIPVRAMLRPRDGFTIGPRDLEDLMAVTERLAGLGVHGFVCGFLDESGDLDAVAMESLTTAMSGLPWTLHRAIDNSRDRGAVREAAIALGGCDTLLTGGSPTGLGEGLGTVIQMSSEIDPSKPPRIMAGAGLKPGYVSDLAVAGIEAFHIGSAARTGWDSPIRADLVEGWVKLLRKAERGLNG